MRFANSAGVKLKFSSGTAGTGDEGVSISLKDVVSGGEKIGELVGAMRLVALKVG